MSHTLTFAVPSCLIQYKRLNIPFSMKLGLNRDETEDKISPSDREHPSVLGGSYYTK